MQSFCERQPGRRASLQMRLTDILPARLNCWKRYARHAYPGLLQRLKMR